MKINTIFNHKIVNDLAWACFGPNLMNDFSSIDPTSDVSACQIALTQQRLDWLHKIDKQPQDLLHHLSNLKSPRLGIYFESLWQFFLQQDPQVDLIAANLPVRVRGKGNSQTTKGEFDIIYYCHDRRAHFHLELAVKFYLANYQYETDPLRLWLGPNNHDRLDLKLQRFIEHQCELSRTEPGKEKLHEIGIESITQEISLKGCLFYPTHETPNCAYLDTGHWRGSWYTCSEFTNQDSQRFENSWQIIDKSEWISPMSYDCNEPTLTTQQLNKQIQEYFQTQLRPLMIVNLKNDNSQLIEAHRLFVTPDDWPNTINRR